jgi:hypothetical protein
MVRINQQGATAGFCDACLCGEGRQSVLAEAGGMVSIGRWCSALRISNFIPVIGIVAHSATLDLADSVAPLAFFDSRKFPRIKTNRFLTTPSPRREA